MTTRSERLYKKMAEHEDSGAETAGTARSERVERGVSQVALMQMLQEQQRQFVAQQEAKQRLIERLMEQQKEYFPHVR